MPVSPYRRAQRSLRIAFAVSLLVHAVVLFVPMGEKAQKPPPGRLTTRLAPKPQPLPAPEPVEKVAEQTPTPRPRAVEPRKRVLTRESGSAPAHVTQAPKFTQAEKQEMNDFLNSLEKEARAQPSLAQRSLAMARQIGRETASQDQDDDAVTIERIPNSPDVDPFSLEMYLDSLVKKLNYSADHVEKPPRQAGYKKASVQLRLNPDGTIRSFEVLNAGDQFDQIAFIKRLVERAAPYSPFPPDIVRSAKSMAILICIVPSYGPGGGMGFTRNSDGRGC